MVTGRVVLAERAVAERRRHQKLGHGNGLGGGRLRLDQGSEASERGQHGKRAGADEQVPTGDHLETP